MKLTPVCLFSSTLRFTGCLLLDNKTIIALFRLNVKSFLQLISRPKPEWFCDPYLSTDIQCVEYSWEI